MLANGRKAVAKYTSPRKKVYKGDVSHDRLIQYFIAAAKLRISSFFEPLIEASPYCSVIFYTVLQPAFSSSSTPSFMRNTLSAASAMAISWVTTTTQ